MDFQKEPKKIKLHEEEEEEEEDYDQPIDRLSYLPQEISLEILSRLPIKSVIQSRFVCRSWNLLSRDPLLLHMHTSRALITQRICLIFHCDYPIRNQLLFVEFSDVNETETVRKIDTPFAGKMPEFSVIGSCNGLLCLIDSLLFDSLYIYNPFTRDYRVLPESTEFQNQIVIYGFGYHEVTKEYKVVKIIYYPNRYNNIEFHRHPRISRNSDSRKSDVQVYNLGSNAWRSIGEAPFGIEQRSSPGVLVNGRLHWIGERINERSYPGIVTFDLKNDSFQVVPRPGIGSLRSWMRSYLAVLGGCLAAVEPLPVGSGAVDIWVMKKYGVKNSWVKEYTLGPNYSPGYTAPELQTSYPIWRNYFTDKLFRILCLQKDGNILLEYKAGTLFSYNPESGRFKNLKFQGMPRLFRTTIHAASLNPVVQS